MLVTQDHTIEAVKRLHNGTQTVFHAYIKSLDKPCTGSDSGRTYDYLQFGLNGFLYESFCRPALKIYSFFMLSTQKLT